MVLNGQGDSGMGTTTTVAQMGVRILGIIQIILGVLFWIGMALGLVNLHMVIGLLFVISLWVLCGVAIKAHVSGGFIALGIIWGLIVIWLGMTQRTMMIGSMHWVIRVLHLLVGLAAMGIGENMAKRIKAGPTGAPVGA
jgi:hypothetical protein